MHNLYTIAYSHEHNHKSTKHVTKCCIGGNYPFLGKKIRNNFLRLTVLELQSESDSAEIKVGELLGGIKRKQSTYRFYEMLSIKSYITLVFLPLRTFSICCAIYIRTPILLNSQFLSKFSPFLALILSHTTDFRNSLPGQKKSVPTKVISKPEGLVM